MRGGWRPAAIGLGLFLAACVLAACGSPERPEFGERAPAAGSSGSTAPSSPSSPSSQPATPPVGAPDGAPAAASSSGTAVAQARGGLVVARSEPSDDAEPVAELTNPIPSGGALVFRVLTPPDEVSDEWLEVMLPVRPNGTTGWIRSSEVDLSLNPYRIEIDTSDHRLELYEDDDLVVQTEIAVGTGNTPTPYGEFYLAELLQPPDPGGSYGPYAFGLSGFSEVLDSFAGGDGVVGIHGTNEPSALGTDVSHGCVRVLNDVIEDMATRVPLGTPVSIVV